VAVEQHDFVARAQSQDMDGVMRGILGQGAAAAGAQRRLDEEARRAA
jgi:hypothetical protein